MLSRMRRLHLQVPQTDGPFIRTCCELGFYSLRIVNVWRSHRFHNVPIDGLEIVRRRGKGKNVSYTSRRRLHHVVATILETTNTVAHDNREEQNSQRTSDKSEESQKQTELSA